jgi:hypothetical protein
MTLKEESNMESENKKCPSSVADLQSQLDELVLFLEREESYTNDPETQVRIIEKLIDLKVWQQA